MFPRPRKITRLMVLALLAVLLLSSYMYLIGDSSASMPPTTLKVGRSYAFKKQDTEPIEDPFSYLDSASGETFLNAAHSIIHNPVFVKERKLSLHSNSSGSTITTQRSPVNPHNFNYIHNPSALCLGKPVAFLIYVHSSPANLKKRQAIRQSWGDLRILSLFNASLVFILGATQDKPLQSLVDMEAAAYGDIVQEDFLDSYRNLTYKGMTALKWTARFCFQVSFILKTDDDILLDVVSIIDHVITKVLPARGAKKLVLCNLWTRMKTMRNPKSKWYLSKEEFPHDIFPPYCSGSSFILSSDLIAEMYRTAMESPFFWVDDYFITGVLINTLGVKHMPFNQAYLLNYNVVEEKLKRDTKEFLIFHIKKLSLFQRVWPLLMRRHPGMKNYLSTSSLSFSGIHFEISKVEKQRIWNVSYIESTTAKSLKDVKVTEKMSTRRHGTV